MRTLYKDCVVPTPGNGGDWGGEKNGVDIPGGQKGTPGIIPEVTLVSVEGAPPSGGSPGMMAGVGAAPLDNAAKK